MRKLDLKDKKLLFELDFDARKTYAELARATRMSKRGAEYKLKNLERDKVVIGYSTIIDVNKVGYNYFRVFIKFQTVTKEFQKEVETYIKNEENIGWALWYHGTYDLGFTIWANTVTQFKELVNKFYNQFGKNISRRTESIGTEILFYKSRFLLNNKDLNTINITESTNKEKLDNNDILVLNALVKQPRATLITLGERTGLSSKLVSYHLKKLYLKKILLGIRPILNYNQLGKIYYKVFFHLNDLQEEAITKLEGYLAQESSVIYVVKAMGTCDLDIELVLDSTEQLYNFIDDIQIRFPGIIKEYDLLILKNTIKQTFLPKSIQR